MSKQRLSEIIRENRNLFITASDAVWDFAETRFQEEKSAALLCGILEKVGFQVMRGIAEIPTAFCASFGSGTPVVAILGEFDALSGLSQKPGIARKEPVQEGGNGHGCGHNLLGAGALAAAVSLKQYMEENLVSGTIRYYGCPAEEGGSGKAFMAKAGVFDDVDAALTWHPFPYNAIFSVNTLANYQVYYKFHGVSSHAGVTPHLGRSALDAVELMNVGVNYLREHIIPGARIHYAVTNTGGISPNVVQAEAEVVYLIRAPKISQVQEIYERVCDVARGAVLMTGTTCEIVFDKACSDYLPNRTLEEAMYANFLEVGAPVPTEAELQFAREMQATFTPSDVENDLRTALGFMGGADSDIAAQLKQKPIADLILTYCHAAMLLPGSTDVGDVSWLAPTAQLTVANAAFGTPGHSWQNVAQGKTSFAHKSMLAAGEVLARTALDLLQQPELVAKAWIELRESVGEAGYACPIPTEVKPALHK